MERHKQLPAMSAKQRERFAERGIEHPVSTFLPLPAKKPGRPADTGPSQLTVDAVLDRDVHSCTVCGDPIGGDRGTHWSIHHRVLKSHGVDNRPCNLIAVCGSGSTGCHGQLHAKPAKAREGGWIVLSTEDPQRVPLAHSQHGWVLLDNGADWEATDPPPDREVDHG